MKNLKRRWRILKEAEEMENSTPTRIVHNGVEYTSPREIAEVMNEYYILKTRELRKDFANTEDQALEITNYLLPNVDSEFSFKRIKTHEMYEILTDLKNSKTCGDDYIAAFILKEMPFYLAPRLTHLFNRMIDCKTFPAALKTSRILPILKKGKSATNPSSYRPISNVNTIEKVLEEAMRIQINKHLEDLQIIPAEHHGGRKDFGTISAKAVLDNDTTDNNENKKCVCTLTTDLSCAFDVIDHELMLQKLKRIGFNLDAIIFMKSYFSNRYQFIQLQGFKSKKIKRDA